MTTQYALKGLPRENKLVESGIYAVVNTTNNKMYVGATNRTFGERRREHFKLLSNETHVNKFLQEDYNKFGDGAFDFYILESIDNEKDIIQAENRWLKSVGEDVLYNIAKTSRGVYGTGAKYHGEFYDPIGREYSVHNLDAFCRERGLNPRHMAELRDGKLNHSMGWTLVDSAHKPFSFVSPTGILYSWIHVISRFCAEHNLTASMMSAVHNKTWTHHKGWRRGDTDRQWPTLVSPTGNLHKRIWNIDRFAKEHGLHGSLLNKVILGSRNIHQGWTLYNESVPIIREEIRVGYQEYIHDN